MNGNSSRYHAEIKLDVQGHEARVNVFADTLDEIFTDLETIADQFTPDLASPATKPIAQRQAATAKPQPMPKSQPTKPVCEDCGSSDYMELIGFKDKKTGLPRQAWKCQQCSKWRWDDATNGKGS